MVKSRKNITRFSHLHGYNKISDIMVDLNPLTGKLYLEALQMTRVAREAYVLLGVNIPS